MEELLKEVRLSEKKKERIDAFLKEVIKRIQKVPPVPEAEVRQIALGTVSCDTLCCFPKKLVTKEVILTATRLNQDTGHALTSQQTYVSCTNFVGVLFV